ncbi:MAG: hypothetical protein GXP45_06200 [bacterium]|nr:hypothetical protein [bacterium]
MFYAFGFFPTNKVGKQRSTRMTILVLLTIIILFVPLWKGMQTIAFNFKTNAIINESFDTFRKSINPSIKFQNPSFQKINDNTLKVNATLSVPSNLKITENYKKELTQRLALATQESIELQLNIIGVSSIYIDTHEVNQEQLLQQELLTYLKTKKSLTLIDFKIAHDENPLVLITLFDGKNQAHQAIEQDIKVLVQKHL